MTRVIDNQRGFALVLALMMIVVLSLLGIMSLNTADTELKIASNYGRSQHSISAASSVVSYAQTNGDIYEQILKEHIDLGDGNPATQSSYETDLAGLGAGVRLHEQDEDGNSHPEWNRVEYLGTVTVPPEAGTEDILFKIRYYKISVMVEESRGAVTRVESQAGRLVPASEAY